MPRYRVPLAREASEHNSVIVEADNPGLAETAALEKSGRYGEKLKGWGLDDGNMHDVYIPDRNAIEEIIEEQDPPYVPTAREVDGFLTALIVATDGMNLPKRTNFRAVAQKLIESLPKDIYYGSHEDDEQTEEEDDWGR